MSKIQILNDSFCKFLNLSKLRESIESQELLVQINKDNMICKGVFAKANLNLLCFKGILKGTFEDWGEKRTDLNKIPLWDFRNFGDINERLSDYLLMLKDGNFDPWKVPPISIESFRGCIKSMRKKEGPCKFCYESNTGKALSPENFWKQIQHLDSSFAPGLRKVVYMADDIFTISPKRIIDIAETKPSNLEISIRAYSYLPDLARLSDTVLRKLAENLRHIGVFNLFFGSETYDSLVLNRMNKKGVSVDD